MHQPTHQQTRTQTRLLPTVALACLALIPTMSAMPGSTWAQGQNQEQKPEQHQSQAPQAAQSIPAQQADQAPQAAQAVQAGERLSTHLRRQGWVPSLRPGGAFELQSLMLRRANLQAKQAVQRTQLLTALHMLGGAPSSTLAAWVQAQAVTGRMVLPSTDADHLEAHPELNPILEPGDQVALPPNPGQVVVITAQGSCVLPVQQQVAAPLLVAACSAGAHDTAWVVGPDGQRYQQGLAGWNASAAKPVLPGSWVLAGNTAGNTAGNIAGNIPSNTANTHNTANAHPPWPALAAWLATQGPAQVPAALQGQVRRVQLPAAAATTAATLGNVPSSSTLSNPTLSSSSWGWVGLLQTPTARMRPVGSASLTLHRAQPYSRYSLMLQPFDWFEGGFRYTKITNRDFGPADFSGDQRFLDKNIDFKLRLLQETAHRPSLAVGLNDIGGTGLFAGEYLVANKRWYNLDASLGLGWGYWGRAADARNPLRLLSSNFEVRPGSTVAQGGQLSPKSYFRGPVAWFGGVQWQLPWERWQFKLEREGNNYQSEPLQNNQVQSSRWNYGLVYRASNSVQLHLGVERGNTLSVGLSLFENLSTFNTPKISDPKPLPVRPLPVQAAVPTAGLAPSPAPQAAQAPWEDTLRLFKAQTNWEVESVSQRGGELKLTVNNARAAYHAESLERAAEVLHQQLPAEVQWFSIEHQQNGVAMGQHVIDRSAFVKRRTQYTELEIAQAPQAATQTSAQALTPATTAATTAATMPSPAQPSGQTSAELSAIEGFALPYQTLHTAKPARFTNRFALGYRQVFGGADGLLYQFVLANDTRLQLAPSTWVDGRLAYRALDNFEKFKQGSESRLPPVRTKLREYAITSDFTIPHFNLKHMGSVAPGHYYSLYGGLIEQMFAGVGGEYLWRPHNSPVALGVDVNRVRQRAFEQNLELQGYTVNTGHLTAYVDTGIQNILATVSVGQYLAGDRGVTVDVSREFTNGVRMGAFFTRTNVPAEVFGEGSFDKGIYVTVPFGAFFTRSLPGEAAFLWRPLTRDGGAKLARGLSLYGETQVRNPKALLYRAGGQFE